MDQNEFKKKMVDNFRAYQEIHKEMLSEIDSIQPELISRQKAIKELGFTNISLELLERLGLIKPEDNWFNIQTLMKVGTMLPVTMDADKMRTKRKRQNINGIFKEFLTDKLNTKEFKP